MFLKLYNWHLSVNVNRRWLIVISLKCFENNLHCLWRKLFISFGNFELFFLSLLFYSITVIGLIISFYFFLFYLIFIHFICSESLYSYISPSIKMLSVLSHFFLKAYLHDNIVNVFCLYSCPEVSLRNRF